MKKIVASLAAVAAALTFAPAAYAGPFIIDGTDADDHGSATATANVDGWLYIQRALENLAGSSALTRTQKTIAVLGADDGTTASDAARSAVSLSTALSSAGWQLVLLNEGEIGDFFSNTGTTLGSNNASLIYMPSDDTFGGLSSTEQAIIDANATNINSFLGAGGGLFSMTQGYGWLQALVPGLLVLDAGDQGISLTPAGQANFPGLTDDDLSTGPFHNTFSNTGAVPVLGVSNSGFSDGQAVILGGAGGSITDPTSDVPEPATWAMTIAGFGMIGAAMRRARRTSVAFG